MKNILKLGTVDLKLIFRDPSLLAFLLLPVLLFVVFLWFLPLMIEKYDFLAPYQTEFLIVAVIENTQAFCFICTMVLLNEKESGVAKVYGVLPLSSFAYLLSRFLFPFLFTMLLNILFLKLQPFHNFTFLENAFLSILAAAVVPLYVLGINSVATNRMQGMIYVKAFNMIVLLPIAAFFLPEEIKHFFGILPTHWIFQSIDLVASNGSIVLTAGIGYLFFGFLTWYVSKKFIRKHFA